MAFLDPLQILSKIFDVDKKTKCISWPQADLKVKFELNDENTRPRFIIWLLAANGALDLSQVIGQRITYFGDQASDVSQICQYGADLEDEGWVYLGWFYVPTDGEAVTSLKVKLDLSEVQFCAAKPKVQQAKPQDALTKALAKVSVADPQDNEMCEE